MAFSLFKYYNFQVFSSPPDEISYKTHPYINIDMDYCNVSTIRGVKSSKTPSRFCEVSMSPSHAFGRLSIVSCRTAASFFIKEGWGKKKDKGTQLVRSRLEALLRNRCVFRCMHNTSLHERQWRHDRHQWNVQPARRNSVRFSSAGILETRRNRPRRGTSVNVNHACATFEE